MTCADCGAQMMLVPEPMLGGFVMTWVCPVAVYTH
jgi:hypothetical protein